MSFLSPRQSHRETNEDNWERFEPNFAVRCLASFTGYKRPQRPSNAPLRLAESCSLQSLFSFRRNSCPSLPKQKFATPPSTSTFAMRTPPGDQMLSPSPQPLYTLPSVSHLIPSGMPTSAIAKSLRLARKGCPEYMITSKANLGSYCQRVLERERDWQRTYVMPSYDPFDHRRGSNLYR
jgi:hypothetical protein